MEDKETLRNKLWFERETISPERREAAAAAIFARIRELPEFAQAQTVYLYASVGAEVPTSRMIGYCLSHGKIVCLPRIDGEHMSFRRITSPLDLHPGVMGIPEPGDKAPEVASPGFMMVPGLAFDRNGNRLGYGGGYYDRYLAGRSDLFTVGLAYGCQIVDTVPTEFNDVPLCAVATGDGEVFFNAEFGMRNAEL